MSHPPPHFATGSQAAVAVVAQIFHDRRTPPTLVPLAPDEHAVMTGALVGMIVALAEQLEQTDPGWSKTAWLERTGVALAARIELA